MIESSRPSSPPGDAFERRVSALSHGLRNARLWLALRPGWGHTPGRAGDEICRYVDCSRRKSRSCLPPRRRAANDCGAVGTVGRIRELVSPEAAHAVRTDG